MGVIDMPELDEKEKLEATIKVLTEEIKDLNNQLSKQAQTKIDLEREIQNHKLKNILTYIFLR